MPRGGLLHAAVVAVGILEPQTHLGSVFLEVKKLSGVKGSASLPAKAEKTPGQREEEAVGKDSSARHSGKREEEGTHCRMNCTASSYFIPLSMRAKATKTGALEQEGGAED